MGAVVGRLSKAAVITKPIAADANAKNGPPIRELIASRPPRATCHGRRRGSGVTMGPIRMCSVAIAIAPSVTHGSATGSFLGAIHMR